MAEHDNIGYKDDGPNQSNCSDLLHNRNQHTNAMLMDKKSVSNSNNHMISADLATNDDCLVEDKDIPIVQTITGICFTYDHIMRTSLGQIENGNNLSNSLGLKDETMEVDNTAGNLNHQSFNLQDENTENNISISKRPKKMKYYIGSANLDVCNHNALCCKMSIIFGVCFIIGCYLIPIILYYVSQAKSNLEITPRYSNEKNTSNAKIKLMKACNISASDSDFMDQILYTYEALRTINLPSSQQYCSERVETLFCDALRMKHSNELYMKDIMCQQMRQEYCTAEWRMLEVHNQTNGLIDCDEYGETALLNCSDQFGLTNDGTVCLPLCGEFSQYPEAYTTSGIIVFATALFINIIGGIIVLGISFEKRKKMFRFPYNLIMITAGILTFIGALTFISTVTVGRLNILCSSEFLFDAIDNPTTFCTVQGFLSTFGIVLFHYFWLLYICHLALKLVFPLKSAKLFDSKNNTIIYIIEGLIVTIIAAVPTIVVAGFSKYKIISFPPTICGLHGTYLLYIAVIPTLIAGCINLILMLLVLYTLHMHQGIFKKNNSIGKQVCTCQFTIPEVKIVFVLFYWLLYTILLWTGFSIRSGRANIFDFLLRSYTDCMAGGSRKDHDCHMLRLDFEAETYPVLEGMYLTFTVFLNFASLPFVIQFQTIKNFIKGCLLLKLLSK